MFTENNCVELSGIVGGTIKFSHECFGENFYLTSLNVMRDSGVTDTLPLMISGIENEDICNKHISIKGTVRTHNEDGHVNMFVLVDEFKFENCEWTNEVSLNGYICKRYPLRKTPNGRVICDVVLAVNRPYGKSDYITCIFWGKKAESIEKLNIGEKVNIVGRLQSRKYNKNNEERITYEVSVK